MGSTTATILGVGAIVVLVLFAGYLPAGLTYQADMVGAAGKVSGALFVVAVLLERSIAVVTSTIFGEQEARLRADYANNAADAVLRLEILQSEKERLRLCIALIASIVVSAAGIRTLAALVTAPPSTHLAFFHVVDVLLTAGLLAGGSNGLAKLMELFKAQLAAAYVRHLQALREHTKPTG